MSVGGFARLLIHRQTMLPKARAFVLFVTSASSMQPQRCGLRSRQIGNRPREGPIGDRDRQSEGDNRQVCGTYSSSRFCWVYRKGVCFALQITTWQ